MSQDEKVVLSKDEVERERLLRAMEKLFDERVGYNRTHMTQKDVSVTPQEIGAVMGRSAKWVEKRLAKHRFKGKEGKYSPYIF